MRIRVDLIEKRSFYAEIPKYSEPPLGVMYGSRMLRHSGRENTHRKRIGAGKPEPAEQISKGE